MVRGHSKTRHVGKFHGSDMTMGAVSKTPEGKERAGRGKRANRKIRKAGIHTWVGAYGSHPTRRPSATFTSRGSRALFMDSQNGFLLGSGGESDRVLAVRKHHP